MPKWQYRCETFPDKAWMYFEDWLNLRGEQGWEIATITESRPQSKSGLMVIFKQHV